MEKGKRSLLKKISLGAGISMGSYLLLLVFAAYLTTNGQLREEWMQQTTRLCACVASAAGALSAKSKGQHGAAYTPMLAEAVFFTAVLAVGILGGEKLEMRGIVLLLISISIGALSSLLLLTRHKQSGRGRRRRAGNIRR